MLDQAKRVVSLLREVLDDDVLGVYLHGSAAAGRLRPASDIDLLSVVRRPTTPVERRILIERLLQISGRGDPSGSSRSVDLAIVVQADVRPWHYPPRLDFQYGDWWRGEFAAGDFAPWESPKPDLALQLAMTLQANRPLLGPPAAGILDPIPVSDIHRAMIDSIPALLSYLDGDEANVVLTFVRIWRTLATGAFWPKDVAADWALQLLPPEHHPVLEHARAIYVGEATDAWGDLLSRVRPFVDHVVAEIEFVAPSSPTA